MPQIRYFHRGRYFRPSKPLHFLPPLKLSTGATQHPLPTENGALKKTSLRGRGRDRKHSRYRKMVMTLASYLTLGNVADMKFLCRDHVRPPQIVDEVTSARHLLALLENQRLLAENSLYFLQTLLYYIARPDLYQIVLEFRAGRQDDYRGKGVNIIDQYQVNLDEDAQRLKLANDLLKFRKDLKPRRRLNQVEVNEMRRRLDELSTKMQGNINIIQGTSALEDEIHADNTIDPAEKDSVEGDGNVTQACKNAKVEKTPYTKSRFLKPALELEKTDTSSREVAKTGDPGRTESVKGSDSRAPTKNQRDTKKANGTGKLENQSYLTGGCSGEDYFTEDEAENSEDLFEYETPCPPPRESALGINGVRVYDDVGSKPIKFSKSSILTEQMTSKIHRLQRQSKEQRHRSTGRVQRKRKTKPAISNDTGLVPSRDDLELSNAKDDVKLPDIYDKYARQTAVQYYS